MKREKSLEDGLYKACLLMLLPVGILTFLYLKFAGCFLKIPCVLYSILGVYCPGCGGTRALRALFQGKLLTSFWYHPLVLYTVVILGGFFLTQTWERLHLPGIKGWKFHSWYLFGAVGVLFTNFIVKNILLWGFQIQL